MPVSRAWARATTPPAAAADLTLSVPTGTVAALALATAPTGWLKANGSTIGSADSGATRANADTAALFAVLWAITGLAILTSAGAGSTRGASAAADFAANKRLTLPDLRGEFLRGLDDSRGVDAARVLGSAQTEMIGTHVHPITMQIVTNRNTTAGGADSVMFDGGTDTTGNNTGTENRPRNVAVLYAIKM